VGGEIGPLELVDSWIGYGVLKKKCNIAMGIQIQTDKKNENRKKLNIFECIWMLFCKNR